MTRLYHPDLDRHIDVAHPKAVAVHKRSGWLEADEADQPRSKTTRTKKAGDDVADEVGDSTSADLEGDD